MIVYTKQKNVWENSFINNNKLILANFDDKVFTDHLSLRDKIVMYKSLFYGKCNNIYCNFEDYNHHKINYYKPTKMFNNIVSFQDYGNNCFYYTIGTEHILNDNFKDLRKNKINLKKGNRDKISIGWICSNMSKLQKYWSSMKSLQIDVKLYGAFGIPVKITENSLDEQRNWIHSAQNCLNEMDAHFCMENTNATGYFSAIPAYAIFSGTAPIIMGDNIIHRNIFSKNSYIEYNNNLTKNELIKLIRKCLLFINNCEYNELFTNLYLEYLDFSKKANFFDQQDIKTSKNFRKKIIT